MPPVIDQARLDEIKKTLKELPKLERAKSYNGPEALNALKKEIRALYRKGYDFKGIARILKKEGLSASAAKVKKILGTELGNNGSTAGLEAVSADDPDIPNIDANDTLKKGSAGKSVKNKNNEMEDHNESV